MSESQGRTAAQGGVTSTSQGQRGEEGKFKSAGPKAQRATLSNIVEGTEGPSLRGKRLCGEQMGSSG